MIANSCAYLNSAINPLLYAFLNRSFRTNCGNLLSQPSCSLFCADDERRPSQAQQRTLPVLPSPSTQLDRFSYQSTKRQSESSIREKRKKKVLIVDKNQMTIAINDEMESPNYASALELNGNVVTAGDKRVSFSYQNELSYESDKSGKEMPFSASSVTSL